MPDTAVSDPFAEFAKEATRTEDFLTRDRADLRRQTESRLEAVGKEVVAAQERTAAAVKPKIAEAQKGIAEIQAMPKPPAGPVLPGAPSVGLHHFLAPVQGESPEASINKFIQQLGLLGTFIGGLSKGSARASLAALTGALTGWQQGDRERADRAFADWKVETDRLLTNWRTERQSILDIINDKRNTLQDILTGVKLAALAGEMDVIPKLTEQGNLEGVIKRLDKAQEEADKLKLGMERIASAKELKLLDDQRQRDLAAQRIAQQIRHDAEVAEYKRDMVEETRRHNREVEANQRQANEIKEQMNDIRRNLAEGKTKGKDVAYTLLRQIRDLVPDMKKKGFIPDSTNVAATQWAHLNRLAHPSDPTLTSWKMHESTMVSVGRQLGDIGPRAMAAFDSLLGVVRSPGIDKGIYQSLDMLEEALDAGGGTRPSAAPGKEESLPAGAHREGNDIVSDSGKYIWRGGAWQTR